MWEIVVHLAVAGCVYDGVFFCCPFSPRDVLDGILDLIESVSLPTFKEDTNSRLSFVCESKCVNVLRKTNTEKLGYLGLQ